MIKKIFASPSLVRVIPFATFAALTMLQGRLGNNSQYWIYLLKTVIGIGLLGLAWPYIKEMRWKLSWEAVVVGIGVFALWVGLDGHYPMLAQRTESFNPGRTYGAGSALALIFIFVRITGSSLVVPPLEEVFYRSLAYRYFIKSDFLSIPFKRLDWRAYLVTGAIFGISHFEWLPGVLCAFAYQGLVIRKDSLSHAITAHAVTNFLLGVWVVSFHAYRFW
jgi:CAAX prenyl protease-like protein